MYVYICAIDGCIVDGFIHTVLLCGLFHLCSTSFKQLEETLKEETDRVQEKIKKLKEDLQQEQENEISALKSVFEEERGSLQKAFDADKSFKSEQFDLDNTESKILYLQDPSCLDSF